MGSEPNRHVKQYRGRVLASDDGQTPPLQPLQQQMSTQNQALAFAAFSVTTTNANNGAVSQAQAAPAASPAASDETRIVGPRRTADAGSDAAQCSSAP